MTDLHHVLPDFSTQSFSHILPSLEKAHITTSDLLTLEAIDVARRALVPVAELQRLANDLLRALHFEVAPEQDSVASEGVQAVADVEGQVGRGETVRTLDAALDSALGGGIPKGYVVEITGERFAAALPVLICWR